MSEDNVIKLVERNVADIPAMMEAMAKEIREGNVGTIVRGAAVFMNDQSEVTVCGWGSDMDELQVLGLLSLGQSWFGLHRGRR